MTSRGFLSAQLNCLLVALLFTAAPLLPSAAQKFDADSAHAATPGTGGVYLAAAIGAAAWLEATALETPYGLAWSADPDDPEQVSTHLYHGSAGIILFFIELSRATGDTRYLDIARAAANYLDSALQGETADEPHLSMPGLYVGLSGLAFVFNETYEATGEERYRESALRAIENTRQLMARTDSEASWQSWPDVMFGIGGTGLTMLYAHREMGHPDALALATRIGDRLLEIAEEQNTGLGWRISPETKYLMPNFSHGAAGVSYFLADLYATTGERRFLDGALAGANHLLSIADVDGEICLIFHKTDGGENRHYLGWCHGPAGTARTFYKLWQVTGDDTWLAWTKRSARGVLESGIPEQRTDGFWNNVSQCCGSSGVAELFLGLYSVTADEAYLRFAQRMADDVLERATVTADGMRWIQAEHRVKPDLLVAQTGYMQGAAGVGLMLLHLATESNRQETTRLALPDWPFDRPPAPGDQGKARYLKRSPGLLIEDQIRHRVRSMESGLDVICSRASYHSGCNPA